MRLPSFSHQRPELPANRLAASARQIQRSQRPPPRRRVHRILVPLAVALVLLVSGDTRREGMAPGQRLGPLLGGVRPSAAAADPEVVAYPCTAWVAPDGSDEGTGRQDEPWRTIGHAVAEVPDEGCAIFVQPGTYHGTILVERRFERTLTIRAAVDHRAVLVHSGSVLRLNGARNVTFDGFRLHHAGPDSTGHLVTAANRHDEWTEHVTIQNSIVHDCYACDLIKLYSGVRHVVVQGNVLYNQGSGGQHVDISGAVGVVLRGNILFNDFARSGRPVEDSKSFIAVKGSGDEDDGEISSRDVRIERNIFANWEGAREPFILVGNGGRPYRQAESVQIESNLFLGGSSAPTMAPLAVRGVRDVAFNGNTVVGDLPGLAAGIWYDPTSHDLTNDGVVITNNIYSDPSGSMSRFSRGRRVPGDSLVLDRNLYWNGHRDLPGGNVVEPADDRAAVVGDPRVWRGRRPVRLPIWTGSGFVSGGTSITEEFERLVRTHGAFDRLSAAVDAADPDTAPATDILGQQRGPRPDLGAYEAP